MTHPQTDLSFLLTDFANRVPHVAHALALSADGLQLARTPGLTVDAADQLAAVASGLTSLLAGAARVFESGPVYSNLTHMAGGFMFSMSVSTGASLLVLADVRCDVGQVSHEMTALIERVGPALTPRRAASLAGARP